jgi:Na+/H+ antiporter NhaA
VARAAAREPAFSGSSAWSRNLQTPLRRFLRAQTGSAAVLLAATLTALAWVNIDAASYDDLWDTVLSIQVGDSAISMDLRGWINSGLMTLFFFVVGLEARREFDMGELRERRRVTLPLAAGIGGMIVPVAIYLAINAGRSSAHGWGVAMSTDTAFALGMIALVGPHFPVRLRAFLLTVAVVDDVVALAVIGLVYSEDVAVPALLAAVGIFAVIVAVRALGVRAVGFGRGAVYALLGGAGWRALHEAGVEPIVIGLAMGLLAYAYPAARGDLERATDRFRLFREQPTPELAREARLGLSSAISANERLQQAFLPWTSYVIVPLFALANAGVAVDAASLRRAFTSPVTLGILFGYVAGKPAGILGATWLVTRLSGGRVRPPVGWASVAGAGSIAGIGFTVALLIATLAFSGAELEGAKIGVLSAALGASLLAWLVFRVTALMPAPSRVRALVGTATTIVDLAVPVDPERDRIRGPKDATVTLVEYGDFECPYCGQAETVIRELLAGHGELRYVWRHLPLNDVHPRAQLAAEAVEAAAKQGAFWEMHDLLLQRPGATEDLSAAAAGLGLDVERFDEALRLHAGSARIAEDVDGADLSGVSGTPTFFVNGRRHDGAYDVATLSAAVRAAKARAMASAGAPAPAG